MARIKNVSRRRMIAHNANELAKARLISNLTMATKEHVTILDLQYVSQSKIENIIKKTARYLTKRLEKADVKVVIRAKEKGEQPVTREQAEYKTLLCTETICISDEEHQCLFTIT